MRDRWPVAVAMVVLTLVGVFLHNKTLQDRLERQQQELAEVELHATNLRRLIGFDADLKTQAEQLNAHIEVIAELKRNQRSGAALLEEGLAQ